MTTRAGLLQAIMVAPDDDHLRLVYADLLEETGGAADLARAELIRFQIETARLPEDHADKLARIQQAVWMTDRHKATWFPWVRNEGCRPYPQRGFLDSWFCGSDEGHEDDLADAFRHEPITEVTLAPEGDRLSALASWSEFARIRKLKLWPGTPEEGQVPAFLSSPHLSGLREFEYMGRRGTRVPIAGACVLLATLPQYSGLSSLSFLSAGMGDEGALALADSRTLTGLRSLCLQYCDLGLTGCRRLLGSSLVSCLTNLNLGGNLRDVADGEALARLLADSNLRNLESLTLDETPFDDLAAAHLARTNWPAIKSLVLSPNDPHDSSTRTGLAAMTSAGLRTLAASPWFPRLEYLDLSGHNLGDEGATVLADAGLSRLQHLTMTMIGLTAAGLRPLTRAYSSQLRLVQLYGNPLGDEGARVVADAEWPLMAARDANGQVGLLMGGCDVGDEGARALLASTTIPVTIPDLFLGSCRASPETVGALAKKYSGATIRYG